MSKNVSRNTSIRNHPFFYLSAICLVLLHPWTAQADSVTQEPSCLEWTEIHPEGRFQNFVEDGESSRCFGLYIPQAGVVAVDITSGLQGAFLEVVETFQDSKEAWLSRVAVERQGLSSLRVKTDGPAFILLNLWSQGDPRSLGTVTVITDFLPGNVAKDLEDDEREDPGEIEIEPWDSPKDKQGPWDLTEASALAPPCRAAQTDDHGDTARCATWLSELPAEASGEIINPTQDDEDVFGFDLDTAGRVQILLDSKADLGLMLENALGQRLIVDGGACGPQNRLAMILLPGRYVVRVVGGPWNDGAAYELRIETPDDAP